MCLVFSCYLKNGSIFILPYSLSFYLILYPFLETSIFITPWLLICGSTRRENKPCLLVGWAQTKHIDAVQRSFRTHYNIGAPYRNSIYKWMKKFQETASVNESWFGRSRVWEECVEFIVQHNNKLNFLSNPFNRLILSCMATKLYVSKIAQDFYKLPVCLKRHIYGD